MKLSLVLQMLLTEQLVMAYRQKLLMEMIFMKSLMLCMKHAKVQEKEMAHL